MISTKTIYSSLISKEGREVGRKEEEKERGKKDEKEKWQDRQEKYFFFFFPVCKKEGNS